MSTRRDPEPPRALVGFSEADAAAIGTERAAQARSFRLILMIAQQLRYLIDQLYRADGLTSQQATLLTVVRTLGRPSLSEAAAAMLTSHQNIKQLVTSLTGKGFLRLVADRSDARVRRLTTTPKNERHWAARNPHDFESVGVWFGGLSKDEVQQLFGLLVKLQRGLHEPVRAARAGES